MVRTKISLKILPEIQKWVLKMSSSKNEKTEKVLSRYEISLYYVTTFIIVLYMYGEMVRNWKNFNSQNQTPKSERHW